MNKTLVETPKTLSELGGVLLNWLQMSGLINNPVISLSPTEFKVTGRNPYLNQGKRGTIINLSIAPDARYYSHSEHVEDYLPLDAGPLARIITQLHKIELANMCRVVN